VYQRSVIPYKTIVRLTSRIESVRTVDLSLLTCVCVRFGVLSGLATISQVGRNNKPRHVRRVLIAQRCFEMALLDCASERRVVHLVCPD
jgi:hypothetical protein